ncbi:MAG: hypothetical protein ABWY71_00100 [Candidatus Saccharimonadales bacterium]
MSAELFTDQPTPAEMIAPPEQSPSPLAGYTLTEMVEDLDSVAKNEMSYAELRAKQEAVLAGAAERIAANTDLHAAKVTQMDLAFMLGGYLKADEHKETDADSVAFRLAPPQLLGLLKQQADRFGIPPLMDYDLIIDVNSSEYLEHGHMRTFTGHPGERDFYLGHHLSEPYVKAAAYQLRTVIDTPHQVDVNAVLESAADNMRTFRQFMQKYIKLSTAAFGNMRPYLASYPGGIRNASGAFMPGVPLAELALHAPTDEHGKFLDESAPYFPQWAQTPITDAREASTRGRNIMDMVTSGEISLTDEGNAAHTALREFVDEFVRFRMAHHAATRKQIPGAFPAGAAVSRSALREFGEPDITSVDGVKGTADFNIQNVLGGSINRLLVTLDAVEDTK